MRSVSPRPVIVRNHKTWTITPGMSFSVAEDIYNRVWIVESCPAGTQFWSVSQASMLTGGEKTGDPLEAAIAFGSSLQQRLSERPARRKPILKFGLPTVSVQSYNRERAAAVVGRERDRELVGV